MSAIPPRRDKFSIVASEDLGSPTGEHACGLRQPAGRDAAGRVPASGRRSERLARRSPSPLPARSRAVAKIVVRRGRPPLPAPDGTSLVPHAVVSADQVADCTNCERSSAATTASSSCTATSSSRRRPGERRLSSVGRPGDALPASRRLVADKAYDVERLRDWLKSRRTKAVIPSTATRTVPYGLDRKAYRRRNQIERLFCRLKNWRRLATRYDRLARNFLSGLALIAAATEWTQ